MSINRPRFVGTIILAYWLALYGVLLAPSRAHNTVQPAYDFLSLLCSNSSNTSNKTNGNTAQYPAKSGDTCPVCAACGHASPLGFALPPLASLIPEHSLFSQILPWKLIASHLEKGWSTHRSARGPPQLSSMFASTVSVAPDTGSRCGPPTTTRSLQRPK